MVDPTMTVTRLIDLCEREEDSGVFQNVTEVLSKILDAAMSYYDDRDPLTYRNAVAIPMLAFHLMRRQPCGDCDVCDRDGLVNDLIQYVGRLAYQLSWEDVSPTTRQRLKAIETASGWFDDAPTNPTETCAAEEADHD
jgi:hypothetical protein